MWSRFTGVSYEKILHFDYIFKCAGVLPESPVPCHDDGCCLLYSQGYSPHQVPPSFLRLKVLLMNNNLLQFLPFDQVPHIL